MTPEDRARVKIDKQLNNAGWDIVSRNEYIPMSTTAVKEALMQGNTESDYLLFIDNKAVAVLEAKREENNLGDQYITSIYSKLKYKSFPIEVKSGKRYTTKSLTKFKEAYGKRMGGAYVIHPKNLSIRDDIICISSYMTICL